VTGHDQPAATTLPLALDRTEKEARRDLNAKRAEFLLGLPEPEHSQVSAAVAHATLAAYYQARIEWEHGIG
jgi:hypothetical protein